MLNDYLNKITLLIQNVQQHEKETLKKAAEEIARCIENGGIVHLFGCGHSHMLTEEVFYRAGGLVPIHPIFVEELMLHKDAVRSSQLERQNDYAKNFMNSQPIEPGDILIVISNSGINPVPIDAAQIAKQKGAFVIGLTSLHYAESVSSRHKSGKHLSEVVDLVIHNHVEKGDACMEHQALPVKFGPGSTIIGAAILNSIIVEAVNMMANKGVKPPVLLSGNIEGADEYNKELTEQYQKRIGEILKF
ncbi:SIS domain-containing protein [Bacillus taeanensis]|uniref:UPF0309 protein DS031_07965 n=1 Tax=Bacillus taeanensis TaxID=273032 RepID=A0A366XZB8_9BACI|nr:SIS domain-containing protein [Bacillus taeanensis]RBW70119.1 hypothetical protein DS031_07965 [Bacillus taeanensis]